MQIRPGYFPPASMAGLLAAAILLASTVACQQQPASPKPAQIPSSPAAASIGSKTITEADIDAAIQALPESLQAQRSDPQLRSRVLHVLLRRQALSQQALDLNLDSDPLIHHRIVKARDDILIESLQEWKMRRMPEPDDSAINTFYQAHLADFTIPEQVHARHILLGSEKQASDVLQTLRKNKGKDFAALAAEFSRDDGTKALGGDLNWFPRGVMVNSFEEAVFKLQKPGDISEPVKTPFGWHIIELIGKRPASRQTLAEAREDIAATLKQQAMSNWINELTESAGTRIRNPQYTGSVVDPSP